MEIIPLRTRNESEREFIIKHNDKAYSDITKTMKIRTVTKLLKRMKKFSGRNECESVRNQIIAQLVYFIFPANLSNLPCHVGTI